MAKSNPALAEDPSRAHSIHTEKLRIVWNSNTKVFIIL